MCKAKLTLHRYCGHLTFSFISPCTHLSLSSSSSSPSSFSSSGAAGGPSDTALAACTQCYRYSRAEIADGCGACKAHDGLHASFRMRAFIESQLLEAEASGSAVQTLAEFRDGFEAPWLREWVRETWKQDVRAIGWFREAHGLKSYAEAEPRFLWFYDEWLAQRGGHGNDEGEGKRAGMERKDAEWAGKKYDMQEFVCAMKTEIGRCRCVWGPARIVARQHLAEWTRWRAEGKAKGKSGGRLSEMPADVRREEYFRLLLPELEEKRKRERERRKINEIQPAAESMR